MFDRIDELPQVQSYGSVLSAFSLLSQVSSSLGELLFSNKVCRIPVFYMKNVMLGGREPAGWITVVGKYVE